MTIRHHISDPLLMSYSAAQLPEAFNLVVATHVSLCDECRARLAAFDAVGGAVLEQCDAVALGEQSLAAVMARVMAEPGTRRTERPAGRRGIYPPPLADYLGSDLAAVKWRSIGMGVRQAVIPTTRDATARLLCIPAGAAVPDHGHRGVELTLVLQGAFADTTDRFGPGDVEIADASLQHQPVAEAGADCICLAATDAPLRFSGLVARMAQPFFRI